jgi:MinD-like ATPase involved in chromosome partitioning or flagellar assembly
VRASALGRFTIRQPTGVEIVPGYRRIAVAAIDRHACETLASVLRRHRQMLLVDTGNNTNSSAWQWAAAADVVVIPVPLRGTIPGMVAEMIDDLAGVAPEVLDRVLMLITEGPDDDPETEFDDVETFIRGGIASDRFVRIPYDRLLHSGRINYQQLQPKTRTALIAAAAKVIDLLATIDPTTEGLIDTTELHSITRPQPITRIRS